jgi:catechol 2,3-dioxygenase-like lactoylglutathione lyase family enzyme
MQVTGIGWAGTRTDGYGAMVAFCTGVLGLTREYEQRDFAVLGLPSGDTFEVFGPSDQGHRYFTTGPVVGFTVEDLPAAVAELERAGVELLGGQVDEQGEGWRHFRAPDGNVYELTSD